MCDVFGVIIESNTAMHNCFVDQDENDIAKQFREDKFFQLGRHIAKCNDCYDTFEHWLVDEDMHRYLTIEEIEKYERFKNV